MGGVRVGTGSVLRVGIVVLSLDVCESGSCPTRRTDIRGPFNTPQRVLKEQ
jgi:hypothetical protein